LNPLALDVVTAFKHCDAVGVSEHAPKNVATAEYENSFLTKFNKGTPLIPGIGIYFEDISGGTSQIRGDLAKIAPRQNLPRGD
jgi:hypothetical protein